MIRLLVGWGSAAVFLGTAWALARRACPRTPGLDERLAPDIHVADHRITTVTEVERG